MMEHPTWKKNCWCLFQVFTSHTVYSCLNTFWFPSNISTGWLFIWCITLSDTWTIMGPSAGYWHSTASQRLSCSCELVLSSIHSHNPQHLPPYQLSEENMPTWLWEVVWNVIISLPPPQPHPSNGQPGKSLTLLRISLSTLELDHSSSWPIN